MSALDHHDPKKLTADLSASDEPIFVAYREDFFNGAHDGVRALFFYKGEWWEANGFSFWSSKGVFVAQRQA